jgi:hypothetical protein
METTDQQFGAWNQYMFYGILASISIGILLLVYYEFRVLRLRDHKEKYDYVNLHEIKYFWYAVICFLTAGAFAINTIASKTIMESDIKWFFIRLFISLCFVVVGYFLCHSLIRIYYPKKLANRLHKLRVAPRTSPSGNPMRRLTEEEEDIHLEKSMIKEEDIQIVDYDVWIDEQTGFKKIEKYILNNQATECPECGYYTMTILSEEMAKAPTDSEGGYVIEHLGCSYCGYKEKREVGVAKLSSNIA